MLLRTIVLITRVMEFNQYMAGRKHAQHAFQQYFSSTRVLNPGMLSRCAKIHKPSNISKWTMLLQ